MKTEALFDAATLCSALQTASERLLELRGEHGHWEGELSPSALSTATAVCALRAYHGAASEDLQSQDHITTAIKNGLVWLCKTQSPDGGWGDTTLSFSNISTTALCWAAFAQQIARRRNVIDAAEQWLAAEAGALTPEKLSQAIRRRYGSDQTFSVPILTALALNGRLGDARTAWQHVPQLPFELAACPHQWFAALRLPVVSYALPALIAIGLVRHRQRPSINPFARFVRSAVQKRTLKILQSIQPASGGYLEATPLTSFVVMSLVGAGFAGHSVVKNGVRFLLESVRPDGSWPIDTNLATWVTTLSVNALQSASGHDLTDNELVPATAVSVRPLLQSRGDDGTAQQLRKWLLEQQLGVEHRFTRAAPGGWAWTDLSGGVPDGDDTPGALLALKALNDGSQDILQAVRDGIRWLIDLQNRDGGIPTFCQGWGKLPFDRSSPDLSAHAVRAWLAWQEDMPTELQREIAAAVRKTLHYLASTQTSEGTWAPLWFGNQHTPSEANLTYGTSRVILALVVAHERGAMSAGVMPNLQRALDWLVSSQNEDGGWGGETKDTTPSSIEETALAIEALCAVLAAYERGGQEWVDGDVERVAATIRDGTAWLIGHTHGGCHFPPQPIGFYFAKLWYFERLYPLIYSVAALGRAAEIETCLFTDLQQKVKNSRDALPRQQRHDARRSPGT